MRSVVGCLDVFFEEPSSPTDTAIEPLFLRDGQDNSAMRLLDGDILGVFEVQP
jgi:hypothetical protein